ncbi:ABC transporter ATP-binding protein [bacterium]|nr:ABC transporter ATP-binding protein [bacterium]
MTTVIRIEKLCKNYLDGSGKELKVLKGVSTEFDSDQTVSIVGSSGSGKSTLLQLLGGLDRPTSGKVFYNNKNIYEYDSNTLANWRNENIGFIFQSHHLLPDFSALENTMLPGMIAGLSKQESSRIAKRLLSQVGLAERMSHKPNQLSGGEQQRVAIARALVNSPDIILADEPTGNLDSQTGEKIGAILNQICHEQKATLIMVTHNLQLANKMDFRLMLKNGTLVPPNSNNS